MATEVAPYERSSTFVIDPWDVVLLNDDVHSFEEVVAQVNKATGCGLDMAHEITMKAHTEGEAVCYTGPRERCEHVASVLEEIGLRVRLER
jgi:ATP-dependent Clp protease adapter protein ClpS